MSDLEFYKKLEELKRIGVMEVSPDDACCTILERIVSQSIRPLGPPGRLGLPLAGMLND